MKIRANKNTIVISQSVCKGLGFRLIANQVQDLQYGNANLCPAYFKYRYIDGNFRTSNPMTQGIVLESNLIGGGAKGQVQMELPLLKSGKVSTAQQRIMAHKDRFDKWCLERDIIICENNTQMPIMCEAPFKVGNNRVILNGTVDIFPVTINKKPYIVDIKWTSGRIYRINKDSGEIEPNLTWSSEDNPITQDVCYMNKDFMNVLQAVLYIYIVNNMNMGWLKRFWRDEGFENRFDWLEEYLDRIKKNGVKFGWLVFSGAPTTGYDNGMYWRDHEPKNGEVSILMELIRSASERFLEWESENFKEVYGYDCPKCPLKEKCKTYLNKNYES